MKDTYRKVLQMREAGKTYNEIIGETGLPKSTISWVIGKYFPKNQHEVIRNRNVASLHRTSARKEQMKRAHIGVRLYFKELREAAKLKWLEKLRAYEDQGFIHYIAGLYAGEGTHAGPGFVLSNSNPLILKAFVKFIREVLGLDDSGFAIRLNVHQSMDKELCVRHWEEVLGHRIDGVYVGTHEQKKIRKHNTKRTYLGTLNLQVRKPIGMFDALEEYTY